MKGKRATEAKTATSVGGVVISQNIREEVDFAYLGHLAEPERRLAAYYEYARHSDEIKDLVLDLRKAEAFREDRTVDIDPELVQRVFRDTDVVRMDYLLSLVERDQFPEKPFKATKQNVEQYRPVAPGFGIKRPCLMPWRSFFGLRKDALRRGLDDDTFIEGWNSDLSTINAVSIPWNYTNDEIVEFFRELIPQMRPKNRPEPRKAGRKGRSSGFGAITMLQQLGAYRLYKAGFDFEDAGKLTVYSSLKGWKNAIRSAEERISNMICRPFL